MSNWLAISSNLSMTKPGFVSTTCFGFTSGSIGNHIRGSDFIAKLPHRP
jgi:hypothetical protein